MIRRHVHRNNILKNVNNYEKKETNPSKMQKILVRKAAAVGDLTGMQVLIFAAKSKCTITCTCCQIVSSRARNIACGIAVFPVPSHEQYQCLSKKMGKCPYTKAQVSRLTTCDWLLRDRALHSQSENGQLADFLLETFVHKTHWIIPQ